MSLIRLKQINTGELATFVDSLFSGEFNTLETLVQASLSGVTGVSGKIDLLSGYILDISGSQTLLSGDFDVLEGQFNDMSGTLEGFDQRIVDLSGIVSILSGEFQTVSGFATDALSGVDSLSDSLDFISGSLDDLDAYVDSVSGYFQQYVEDVSGLIVPGITQLTGDVNASGEGIVGATITNDAITNAKLADMANATIKGRSTAGTGDPEDLTISQLLALIARNVSKTIAVFKPQDNEPPSTNFATLDTRNVHPVLDFDTTTQESAIFSWRLPEGISLTNGLTVYVQWAATSATTGTIGWDVAFERIDDGGLDIDSDNFGTAQTITAATVPGTSGITKVTSVNFSQAQLPSSFAAGEMFRIRIRRDVASDTATGDAELLQVEIRLQ